MKFSTAFLMCICVITMPEMTKCVCRLHPMPIVCAILTLVLVILQCFAFGHSLNLCGGTSLLVWMSVCCGLAGVRLLLCCCAWFCCEASVRTQSREEKTNLSLTPSSTIIRMEFDVSNFWRTHLTVAVDGPSCWPSIYKFYFHYINLRAFSGGFFW